MGAAVLRSEAGFSLIEALVALFILAIAAAALIRATEAHVDQVRGLQTRAVAQWVAENRLVELRLAQNSAAMQSGSVQMLGRVWTVDVRSRPSEDPDLAAVEVAVREAGGERPLVTMTGFVDRGASAP